LIGTHTSTTDVMAFMKYLTPYSGKEDPEGWLESYESAAKVEKWSASQMLECVSLKLKKKPKYWLSNLTGESKSKSWEQFLSLFLEEFSTEDHQNTITKSYLSRHKENKNQHNTSLGCQANNYSS